MKFAGIAVLLVVAGPLCVHTDAAEPRPPASSARLETFQSSIHTLLQKNCFRCHGAEKQSGDIRLDVLSPDASSPDFSASVWNDALDQVSLGEMPPPDETPLSDEDRKALVSWILATLQDAAEAKRYRDGRVQMRRLTGYEYANTMRDLLGIELNVAADLPPEPASPEGFLNNGATLEMSPSQLETYLAAARRALAVAIVSGDRPQVFQYKATETAVGRLPRSKEGGHLPVNPEFVLDIPEFPRRGEFRLTVTAHAVIPDGEGIPRLRVSLGNVPGIIHVPRRLVGEADVTAGAQEPQTFEFRGRMEDFPQPGDREFGNVAFKGMIALIDFLDADGRELRYIDRTYSDPPLKKNARPSKKNPGPTGRPAPEGDAPRYDIVIDAVSFEAPWIESWPPPAHTRLMAHAEDAVTEHDQAREIIGRFMERAFRRPVRTDELNQMLTFFTSVRPGQDSFEDAVRETLAAVLVSPHFLYIVEQRPPAASPPVSPSPETVTAFELATRLSYFLWSTMPDGRLTELARNGKLLDSQVLEGEVRRLLDDPRSREFVDHFADQWFDLPGLDRIAVNPEFYPDFDDRLKAAMRTETREVLREIVRHNRSALELIDSDWTVVNRALATHYGLSERPRSSGFERVVLKKEDRRGGILGHGSFLLSQSDGQQPHPIRRAVWILDRLLDTPPAPPPPAVPELDAEQASLAGLTLKQQLEAHRSESACRGCHEGIDPWGIPLEHFDATGRWTDRVPVRITGRRRARSAETSEPPEVDATAVLPDGTFIADADTLKRYLVEERREHFARAVVRRLAGYALGRSLDIGDRAAVQSLQRDFIASGFRLRDLVVTLAVSDLFRSK